ncbi:zinc finger protein 260-like [Chelonus insularis]|uniref:zinc finger protein 260-like n=1 Tax=Chelonus insularis TaxID=460826 RepID=UPI00158E35CE|nr:zinc finger protein 260-like [Chelonus insularis]
MAVVGEFDYLCRLCATKTGILMGLPIFEAGDRLRNIDKKIAACLPVQVSLSDQLPKVVCEPCAFKLDQMFDFREKCLHTEELFMEMLKEIKDENIHHIEDSLQNVNEIPVIQTDIEPISHNINSIQTPGTHSETAEPNIHTMRVMDEMDLAGGEQVVTQEEIGQQETDIEVSGIDCLDSHTVQMVDEHIHDVSNHQITMHLDGGMTVVGNLTVDHLGINYVTAIDPGSQSEEQILHYCENDKYETVAVKEEYERIHDRLTTDASTRNMENNVANDGFSQTQAATESDVDETIGNKAQGSGVSESLHSSPMPSTSQETANNIEIVVEYTGNTKSGLLESILNNPTIDDTGSNWYICPFCKIAANEPNSLVEHFEQHFCSCPCGLFFTSVEEFNLHGQQCSLEKVVGPKNEIEKTESSESVPTTDNTTEGSKKAQSNVRQKWTPKVCNQCGKQYRTNYKLQEHMRKHTGEKPFQCLLCEKAFRSKIGLAQHTATHTGQFDYSCSTCGKGFQCKSYLIVHQRVHSDLKPYPCNTCGQNFKTKQSLLDHQNRHLGVKPYMCEICGRGFITKGLCKSHQKIHSGTDNRQYPCEVCNKMFVSKSYLNTHLRIHTGEKPYLCEVCGKGFLTRVDLKIHSTMHTGEKSFQCEMCHKVFARRAALRCHRRSHTGERPYRCDVCGKTFTQFSPMAIHKRLHTGERPYECDMCGKAFVSRSTMMCHKKKHHLPETSAEKEANNDEAAVNGVPSSIIIRALYDEIEVNAD